MDTIMEKTRELGRAIMTSQEFVDMRSAEMAAMSDGGAASLIAELIALRAEVGSLLEETEPDGDRLRACETRLSELDDEISLLDSIQIWRQAKDAFEAMIQAVNQELKAIILGEAEEAAAGNTDDAGRLRRILQ